MAYPISDVPRRIVYSGSAGVGPYAFTFEVLVATDIAVYKNTTLLTLTTDYTVSINSGTGTGTVTLVVAATGSDQITIVGDRAIQRTSDFVTGGDLFANTLNDELDAQVIYTQQVDEKADRALRAPVTDPTTINMVLPAKADRANSFLTFDANGNPTVTAVGAPGSPSAITRQKFSGNGSNTVFTLASAIGAAGSSAQVYIGGVYQQSGTYTISGTTLTFSQAPVSGTDNIEVLNFSVTALGQTDSSLVTYTPSGTGAVATTVQAKLRETVSVFDFMTAAQIADVQSGTASIDVTAAIQAAVSSNAGAVYFPAATYCVDGRVSLKSNVRIYGDGAASILKKTASSTQRNTFIAPSGSISNVEIDHLYFLSDVTKVNADTAVIDASINTTSIDGLYIHDNLFSYANDGTGCIIVASTPTTTASNIKITDNTFNSVKYFAVATNNNNSDTVIRNSRINITGNVFKNCASFCVTIAGGTGNVVVANNSFSGTNGYGVEFAGPVIGGVIDGNVFSGSFSQIIALSAGASYGANENIIISNNSTQGSVTANWILQGCASMTMQGNRFNTTGQLIFNGVSFGITAFVSGNWLEQNISSINGAVVTQFNNYIGTRAPVNNLPTQYTVDLSGGDTNSTAVITFSSVTSWRPVGVHVGVVQVEGTGSGGAYAESVITARILNGASAVQINKTDIVTSATLTLTVVYGINTMTVTATSSVANVRQIWAITPFGQSSNATTVAVSA